MKFFLRLKHWQLFLVFVGIPLVFEFLIILAIFKFPQDPVRIFRLVPAIMLLVMALYFSWFYTLGTSLYKKLPPSVSMNLQRFKFFLIVPAIYITLVVFVVFMVSVQKGGPGFLYLEPAHLIFFPIFVILHLFSMFCIFYCLYFLARAMKAVEWQRPVEFGDYAGEFFLFWFFVIGVWILQPRINRIFGEEAR
jgi:hypothetical protein